MLVLLGIRIPKNLALPGIVTPPGPPVPSLPLRALYGADSCFVIGARARSRSVRCEECTKRERVNE